MKQRQARAAAVNPVKTSRRVTRESALVTVSPRDRHERFAQEYLRDLNGSAAYRRVYGESSSAADSSYRLLRNPDVARRIGELKRDRIDRMHLEQDRPVRALLSIMESDPAALFDDAGCPLPVRQIPEDTRRALASLKVRVDPVTGVAVFDYKFADRTRAAEVVARLLGVDEGIVDSLPPVASQSIVFGGRTIVF